MTICTPEKLKLFGWKHYAFINQIFGYPAIRKIISEIYPSDLKLKYVIAGPEFEHSFHHIVYDTIQKKNICSAAEGYQNIDIDVNDTLCQSYALMTYFGIPISKTDKVQKQKDMVKMYRKMLNDKTFVDALDKVIHPKSKITWEYDTGIKNEDIKDIPMDKTYILKNIRSTLDEWEDYGYYYFIGKGNCPSATRTKTRAVSRPTTRGETRRRTRSVPATRATTRRTPH